MGRIAKKFEELRRKKEKALIIYMTAGDPSLSKNERLVSAFEREGVDFIELGVPFSDPLADGVVIQEASERSLRKGTHLGKILSLVRNIRRKSEIPLLLMSYLNPIHRFGEARFAKAAREAGVDGLIVPDLPPEEGRALGKILSRQKIDLVYLLSSTSHARRRRRVTRSSKGFIYFVSLTGVTGARRQLPATLGSDIRLAKRSAHLPVCVGFGISKPDQASRISRISDGVIVGSAIVRSLRHHPRMSAPLFARRFVRPFARALGKRP